MAEAKEHMVERVAKALWDANDQSFFKLPWEHLLPVAKTVWMGKARAAIASMRNCTVEMAEAGHATIESGASVARAWTDMIDAALSGSSVERQISSVAADLTPADAANEERRPEPILGQEDATP